MNRSSFRFKPRAPPAPDQEELEVEDPFYIYLFRRQNETHTHRPAMCLWQHRSFSAVVGGRFFFPSYSHCTATPKIASSRFVTARSGGDELRPRSILKFMVKLCQSMMLHSTRHIEIVGTYLKRNVRSPIRVGCRLRERWGRVVFFAMRHNSYALAFMIFSGAFVRCVMDWTSTLMVWFLRPLVVVFR